MEPTRRRALLLALARHAWVAPILALALWLRTARLASSHLYGDPAEYAIVARYLSNAWDHLAYPALEGFGPTPFVSQPPLVLYLMALSMRLLGPTDVAAILPSALLGAATVGVIYALGVRLSGRILGLGAAAMLAVLPYHVQLSRTAQLDAGYVFFLVLTTYFLVAWMQSHAAWRASGDAADRARARRNAVGVGVGGAGAALAKLPGILAAPVVLVVFLLILGTVLLRHQRRVAAPGEARETLLQGALGAAPYAVGAAIYLALLAHLGALTNLWLKLRWQLGRVDADLGDVSELAASPRAWDWYFTNKHSSVFVLFGGSIVTLAAIGAVVALAFLAHALVRRSAVGVAHAAPLLMAATLAAFFLWSERKEGFYLLPFAPFGALFIAYLGEGARRLVGAVARFLPASAGPAMGPAALAVAILIVAVPAYGAGAQSQNDFAEGNSQAQYYGSGTKEAAQFVRETAPGAAQYGTLLGRFALHWYNGQPTYHWYVDHTLIEGQVQEGNLRYIVYDRYVKLPHDEAFMRRLIETYDGQAVKTYRQGWGEVTVFELRGAGLKAQE